MPHEITKNINFHPDHKADDFLFDPASGFLRTEAGKYLLFRAEAAGERPALRSSGELKADKTLSYGKGLYTGNSPESVAPYIWLRPDNVINAYVTPALDESVIANYAQLNTSEALRSYVQVAKRRKKLGWEAVSKSFDEQYGDACLATFDAGLDISTGQALLSTTHHAIDARWGIWRGDANELTYAGQATADSRPYAWVIGLAQKKLR
jgi:hypothetical protein